MKRVLFISILILSAMTAAFSQSYIGKNVVVDTPDVSALSSLSKAERDSVQSMVKSNLESNMQDYLGMVLTGDAATTERIKKTVSRQSESGAYKDGGVEIGAFEHSYYLIESKISRVGANLSISLVFHNLEKNTHDSVSTRKTYTKAEELASHPGAVDEITLLLCDKLGVSLSGVIRMALQKGSYDFSQDQQIQKNNAQIELMKKQQEELRKQAEAAASSTDLNSKTEQAKIQAQIEDLKIRQKQAEEKAKRLAQEKAAQDAEQERNAGRTAEQQKKIIEEAREVERLAAQVRAQKLQSASIYSKFRLLEDKKGTLLKLRQEWITRTQEMKKESEEEENKKKQEILNREYRRAEMAGGKPTEQALEARKKEAETAANKIFMEYYNNKKEVDASYNKSMRAIAEDIVDGYQDLEDGTYEYSSVANPEDLVYVVDTFDGNKMGWPLAVYLYSSGVNISEFHLLIPYAKLFEAIEEKPAVTTGEEFYDAVDRYESLFAQKSKFINCELKVSEAVVYKTPSRYLTTNLLFTITALKTGKTILTEKTFEYQKGNKERAWWYTFNSNKQDVSEYVDPVIKEREAARKAEKDRIAAEEAAKKREIERLAKEEARAKSRERFAANQKGRKGIYLDIGYGGNDYNSGPFGSAEILFGGRHIFYGIHGEYLYGLDQRESGKEVTYIIAKNNSEYPLIKSANFVRGLAVGGATVALGAFRPFVIAGAGYFQHEYGADAVIYKEDERYGNPGTLARGATMMFGGGFDIGNKVFSAGTNLKIFADIGAGTSVDMSVCFGLRLW